MTSIPASPLVPAVEGISALADNALVVVIQLHGTLDVDRLRRAIRAVAEDLPELGARPRQGFWRTRWEVDENPRWPVTEHVVRDDAGAAELEAELFARPFSLEGELPLEALLVHLADGDRLMIRVNHLLADGGGTKELAYRIASACRALEADPAWRPVPARRWHAVWRLLAAWRPWRVPAYILGVLDDLWSLRPGRGMTVPMARGEVEATRCGRLHLDAGYVQTLRDRWRDTGATVNDLLVTAFARALERAFPDVSAPEINLVCTADLRQLISAADEVENLSAIHTLRMGRRPLPQPRDLLRHTLAQTDRWKRGYLAYGIVTALVALAAALPGAWVRRGVAHFVLHGPPQRLGSVVFTNMGRLDPRRLDFGTGPCAHAYILPPIGDPPALIAAATGCCGAVDVTVAYREPALVGTQVDRLLEAVEDELTALID